jgi:hypothetical protein
MTKVIAIREDTGRTCPYCRFPLKEGSPAERCDACGSLHHEDCWTDGGGCAVLGCSQAGAAGAASAPPGGHQPHAGNVTVGCPGTATALPGHAPPPPGARTKPRLSNQAILIAAGVIAFLGIGTGVVVATSGSSSQRGARPGAATSTSVSGAPSSSQPTAAEESSDRRAISQILSTYQQSYSDHDLRGLSSIFSPGILRHGLAASGCVVSRGQRAVLADYESQFAQGSGSYRLAGLSPDEIALDSKSRAHLHANYVISPGGTGFVNFRFAEIDSEWKVSEVDATCD